MIARLELPSPGGIAIFLAKPETFGVRAEEYKLSQTPYGPVPLPRQYQIGHAFVLAAQELYSQPWMGRA